MQWSQGNGIPFHDERRVLTSLGKRRTILLHELLARGNPSSLCAALVLTRNSRRSPYGASPVAAQSRVEDHRVILEELVWIATSRRPEPAGRPPTSRDRRRGGDIGRDVLPVEEPDGDTRFVPKHCRMTQISIKATRNARSRVKNPKTHSRRHHRRCY